MTVEFERFVTEQGPALLRLAFVLTGDRQRSEDLTQTAFRKWVEQAKADVGRGKPGALTTEERAELSSLRKRMAPPSGEEVEGEIYAQVGETTLLWDEPWVFDSDC